MLRRPRFKLRWLLLAAPAAFAWSTWRQLTRAVRPANPEQAVFEGLQLVRGAKRVLAVTAHPDDLEAICAGTLRLMALAGSEIYVAVLSDGANQTNWRSNLGEIRDMEEGNAANVVGYKQVHRLGFRDLSLSVIEEVQDELAEVWQAVDPDVVFSFDPSFPGRFLAHPDHLTAGRAVLNLARSGLGRGTRVYFYATRDTNVVVDITPVMEDKVRAVLVHRSQLKMAPIFYSWLIRAAARLRGRPVQITYAEGFRALSLPVPDRRVARSRWTRPVSQGRTRGRPVSGQPASGGPGRQR